MSAHGNNRRTTLRWLITAAIVGSSAIALAAPAAPTGGSDGKLEITVFKGTKAAVTAIPSDWPGLANPPFNAYNSYVSIDKKTIDLQKGKTVTGTFEGGSLEATLIDTSPKIKFELVIKDSKGLPLAKGIYSTPKKTPILPAIINSTDSAIVPGLKAL